jgi:hypothetical protein
MMHGIAIRIRSNGRQHRMTDRIAIRIRSD